MYLQTARYVLKSYLGYITKGKKLTESVSYIQRFEELADKNFEGKDFWTLEDFRDLFVKILNYLMSLIGGRIAGKKPGETEMDIIGTKIGLRFQQLAQLHGIHYVLNEFIESIKR
jgi:hypothetical protein